MGKLHDDWKKAKTNAKHLDAKNLFKLKLGEALDKWNTDWDKLKPVYEAKKKEKTLKKAEVTAMIGVMDPLWDKAAKILVKYKELLDAEGAKNKKKSEKADQKEKDKLKAVNADILNLLKVVFDLEGKVAEPVMQMKITKSKLEE